MLSNYVISGIRTGVPLAVGFALTWLASTLKIVVDPSSQAGLVSLLTVAAAGAYWALVRVLERKWPKAGVLLGVAAKPNYRKAQSAKKAVRRA